MTNYAVIPNTKDTIKDILNKDIKSLIIGVKDLSIYPLELTIEEILEISSSTNKNIIIALNKMLHNKDIPLVEEVLNKIKNTNIKGIIFYDIGVLNLCHKLDINKELIISKEHLNASILSNNFYYNKGVSSSLITSDITKEELLEINNNSKINIYYTVYGYLPIFYSRRYLITNYFKYIKEDKKDNTYYIENNNQRYMLKEYNYGTIIYSPLVNLINEVKDLEEINTLIIDLSYTDDISIIDKYINKEVINNTYKGFFNTKTIYKLKDE